VEEAVEVEYMEYIETGAVADGEMVEHIALVVEGGCLNMKSEQQQQIVFETD
jgi:hypothetical protein